MLSFMLKKRLRHFTVDISQEIGAETLVLIGHSGCGKSTMLKMLSGLLSPDEGTIYLDNRLLWSGDQRVNLPPEERNIGYVFQNYALFPHLSVADNVGYGISHFPKEERLKRIEEALLFVGIQHLSHAKPAVLSGGEQQRVALARALVTRPKLLLLDEPLSALDVSTRAHVRAELKELLRKLAIPTIIVTHDYEDARVLADRVAVMDRGRIVQAGIPREIAKYPANDFVAEFIGTNLIPLDETWNNGCLSFDPWQVRVTKEPQSLTYEWNGQIRDMAWMGGMVRLHIEGNVSFYADVPSEAAEEKGFKVNDWIYASITEEDARVVPNATISRRRQVDKTKEMKTVEKKSLKTRWKWAISAVALSTIFITGYAIQTDAVDKAQPLQHTEMFSLVAANATDSYKELMEVFEKEHPGVNMEASFAGTQVLRTQLEQGAKADIFLSADLTHIEALKKQSLIEEFVPVSKGHLVITVPKENRAGIHSYEDLATKPVKLVIGVENVPIGTYTRKSLDKAKVGYGEDFPKKVLAHVVSFESNTKAVLQKVGLGEAEAGIVYKADVSKEFQKKVDVIEIPKEYNVESINYIAATTKTANPELTQDFLQLILSDRGQEVFTRNGYDPLK